MRKVVIPSDFSENAFNALLYATELFKYEQSEFMLLHSFSEEIYNDSYPTEGEALAQKRLEVNKSSAGKLENIRTDIIERFSNPKHSFKTYSCPGLLVDEVNDLVTKENADLVVMGTRGKTNNRNLTFGSNTLQVVKYVQCPVLCIPQFYLFKSPQKILFPTNYMLPYQRRELKLVSEIAREFCSEIHLLYISKFPITTLRQKENQVFIKEAFPLIKLAFHDQYSFHKETVINEFIEKFNIDILVMVNSRHTYLESILSPSTVDKIGLAPKIPFLVLQNFHRAV